jgi:hypothetical protein
MKKLLALLVTAFFMVGMFSTSALADPAKGQKYYLKFMKKATGVNGAKFATQHTQAEWKTLFDGDAAAFIKEYSAKYPGAADFLNGDKFQKFMPHIRDFAIEYASDSGNVPSC